MVVHTLFTRKDKALTPWAGVQIVNDLGVLRELAEALLRYDCVTFLQLLDTLRLSEGRAAVWLLHSAAHTIFDYVNPRPPSCMPPSSRTPRVGKRPSNML